MTDRPLQSDFRTFDVIREIAASPGTVWRLWTDPSLKARWFAEGDGVPHRGWACDPVEGGVETCSFRLEATGWITYAARFILLQPGRRLVYSYTMAIGDRVLSASLSTVTMEAADPGTRLVYTEQANFLDGGDRLETRYAGTLALLDNMVEAARATGHRPGEGAGS